jgi:hypothetical protein
MTPDPFGERRLGSVRRRFHLLGATCEIEADDEALMQLPAGAYAGLPPHCLAAGGPTLRIVMRRADGVAAPYAGEPPAPRFSSGAGLLCATVDARNHVTVNVATRSALVVLGGELLAQPYYARYELLEFALFTLASRSQRLVALHAACVGREGQGVLLLGASGAGKSTMTLACLERGMTLLSEDAVFVAPHTLDATGIASFLHLRSGTAALVGADSARIERHGVPIRRRSGVAKLEIDARRAGFALADAPLRLRAVVCLSPLAALAEEVLRPLAASELRACLVADQSYAAAQPGWRAFLRRVKSLPCVELRRAGTPAALAARVDALLA